MRVIRIVLSVFIFVWSLEGVSMQEAQAAVTLTDEELLDEIQRRCFDYFVKESDPRTGLVRDRADNFRKGAIQAPASIAAVGFALSAYPVGVERGWIDYATAFERTRRTLRFFLEQAPEEHGFFYHFLKMDSGERANRSELSSIDTALFLAGALFAAEYFDHSEIRDLAMKIYERVDFPWMLHGGETLVMGWYPESGFDRMRWDHYNEAMILYLLAIGSPTHPIPAESWKKIARPVGSYHGYRLIQMPPLFTHQYSHIWIDFRDKNDGFADYFKNSVNATLANRAFCIDEAKNFATYGPDSWGLTASDGPFGYRAYGAPPGWAIHDGTVAPTASGGSIVFAPQECIACLRHFYEDLGDKLWGLYGFSDAFNLDRGWFAQEVIGIDQGAMLLMIENYRSGLIWKKMKKNPYLRKAMRKVGFKKGTKEIPWPEPPVYKARYASAGISVDGYLKDWGSQTPVILDRTFKEVGEIKDNGDLSAMVWF
ncbi:MAG: glucoamylase family protein, partial [Candidatus Omnitrophica bacterium]|nr:glucoamylase family protein [Candidatus Omnitrophota bacterium]